MVVATIYIPINSVAFVICDDAHSDWYQEVPNDSFNLHLERKATSKG